MILAFDTSAAHCAAALLSGGRVVVERSEAMVRGQAERLMPMLQEVLAEAGAEWRDLSAIGVGTGPGNFTGIRVAVAAARGLALSLDRPAVGVTGFEALAFGQERTVLAVLPTLRGMVAVQAIGDGQNDAPQVCLPEDLCASWRGSGLDVVGQDAAALAAQTGGRALAPLHGVAVAIALRADAGRAGPVSRPAPFYLRAADAAPPRDPPPVMLA